MKQRWFGLCLVLALASSVRAEQFVEVTADIEITSWRYQEETGLPMKKSRTYAVHCIVGTNTWLIEHNSRTNAKESVWFVQGKVIRQTALSPEAAAAEETIFRSFRRGRSASIIAAPDGFPGSDLHTSLPWFAFCSGPYLKRPNRSVPLPTPADNRGAFGFRDETTVFPDSLGLPRKVSFYTAERELKCQYEVQQSTNVLGWNFPVAFTVVQHEPNNLGEWKKQLAVSARITSIQPAQKPELSEELQERLEYWEQLPSSKK